MVQEMGMEWRRRLFSDCRSVTDLRYRDWCSSSCLEVRCIFWILFLASWQLSCEARSPFILKLVEIFRGLVAIGECVTFAWIPSHVGVHGSTVVDREARDALDEPVSNCSVPCMYFDPFMAKCILGCLQDSWDQQIHNGLHEVHSLVGGTPCSCGQSWKEQVVLTRCRVGHSRLAHGYLLNNGEQPEGVPCGSGCSLEHVLLDCVDVVDVRQNFYSINSLYDLFTQFWSFWEKFIYMQKCSLVSCVLDAWFYLLMFLLFVYIVWLFCRQVCFVFYF